jgi:hypothetical protein
MLNNTTNISSTPLSDIKGYNTFSIPMNSDQSQSESSTGDSNPIGEFSKCNEEIEPKNTKNNRCRTGKRKVEKLLNKKAKRNNNSTGKKIKIKKSKIKKGKFNIIYNILNEFKTSSLYKKFPQFCVIEKNVKNDLYSSSLALAKDVRNVFSKIFSSYLKNIDYSKYNQALILCEFFEKIYKKYDDDSLIKKCKILNEEINKLKKEIHKIEICKKGPNANAKNCKNFGNCEKNEISVQKYKDNILSNIKKLNSEQKKGLLNIVQNNLIDKDIENNIIEFDINKMPINQLKSLDKYINKCICINNDVNNQNQNKNIAFDIPEKKCENNQNKLIEEQQDNNVIEEDVISSSSFLSSDDYEEDDLD